MTAEVSWKRRGPSRNPNIVPESLSVIRDDMRIWICGCPVFLSETIEKNQQQQICRGDRLNSIWTLLLYLCCALAHYGDWHMLNASTKICSSTWHNKGCTRIRKMRFYMRRLPLPLSALHIASSKRLSSSKQQPQVQAFHGVPETVGGLMFLRHKGKSLSSMGKEKRSPATQ